MNSNRGETPADFELPQTPSPESETVQEQAVESPAARPETSGNQPKAPALPAVPDDIPAASQPAVPATLQDVAAQSAAGIGANDQNPDHIERQWIDKVKHVAAETREDPYKQKNQMSKVKADYIQKRFNKTIKTDEATG